MLHDLRIRKLMVFYEHHHFNVLDSTLKYKHLTNLQKGGSHGVSEGSHEEVGTREDGVSESVAFAGIQTAWPEGRLEDGPEGKQPHPV